MDTPETQTNYPDSLRVYPEKLVVKQPWEKMVNFPGRVILSPLKYGFVGIGEVAVLLEEKKVIPRMKDFLAAYRPRGFIPKFSMRHGGGLSYADKENAIKAINEVGLFQYIEKPWDNEDLRIIIRNGIEKQQLIRKLSEKMEEFNQTHSELQSLHREILKTFV